MKKIALLFSMVILFTFASCGQGQSANENIIIPLYEEETIMETTSKVVLKAEFQDVLAPKEDVESAVQYEDFNNDVSTIYMDYRNTPYRDKLTKQEKELYDDIYSAIISYSTFEIEPIKGKYTKENFNNATDALYGDHAELKLFMYTRNEYDCNINSEIPIKMSVVPSYNWKYEYAKFDSNYMNSYLESINEVCDEIINRMPQNATLTEKYEFLGREIFNMTTYVDKSENEELYKNETGDQASWAYCYLNGPFLYGEGLCQAYAQAYQYLCNRAGLWCICTEGGCHMWNLVMLEDGLTYHVDLTWSDTENNFMAYFLLTQEEIEVNHTHEDKYEWCATGK